MTRKLLSATEKDNNEQISAIVTKSMPFPTKEEKKPKTARAKKTTVIIPDRSFMTKAPELEGISDNQELYEHLEQNSIMGPLPMYLPDFYTMTRTIMFSGIVRSELHVQKDFKRVGKKKKKWYIHT